MANQKKYSFFKYVKEIFRIIFDKENFWVASSLSYYIVLALIPTLYLIEFAFSLFRLPSAIISTYIAFLIPEGNTGVLSGFISNIRPEDYLALLIALFLSFNVAANGIKAFLNVSDRLFELKDEEQNNSIKKKIKSYKITLLFLFLIIVYTIFITALEKSFDNIFNVNIYDYFSFVLTFIFILSLLTFFFLFAPSRKMKIKYVIRGAILSSIGIIFTLIIFNILTSRVINFNNIYGPLSYIVSLLILCYFISFSLFAGLILNAIIHCQLLDRVCPKNRKK